MLPRRNLADPTQTTSDAESDPRIAELQHRLEHLEAAFEGLQDAMHRESTRRERQIQEIATSTQPGVLARALSDEARRRGV